MTVKINNLASTYDTKDMLVAPPNLKIQGNREANFKVCPFTDKLRKMLKKSLKQALRPTSRMTQLMLSM